MHDPSRHSRPGDPHRCVRRSPLLRKLSIWALLAVVWLSPVPTVHAQVLGGLSDSMGGGAAEVAPTSAEAIASRRAEVTAALESLSTAGQEDAAHGLLVLERLQQIDSLLARQLALAAAADSTAELESEESAGIVASSVALNGLLEELWQEEQRVLRSAGAVEDARAELAQARARLETATKQGRLARKALAEAGTSASADLAAAVELAEFDQRLAEESVHLRVLETRATVSARDADSRIESLEQRIAQTRAAISSRSGQGAGAGGTSREAGAAAGEGDEPERAGEGGPGFAFGRGALEQIEQRRLREAVGRELATAELWLAAAEKRFAQQKAPTREQAAQVDALRMRRDALRQQQLLFDERIEQLGAQAEIHRRWEALLREDPSRDELGAWEVEVAAHLEHLERTSLERARQASDVEHRIEHAEGLRAKAMADSALYAALGEQIEALRSLRRTMLAEIDALPAGRRLAERYQSDLEDRLGHLDPTEIMAAGARSLRELWGYEITTVDDAPITIGSLVLALGLFAVGMWVSRWGAAGMARVASERLGLDAGASHALQTLSFYTLLVSFTLLALRAVHFPLTAFTVLGGALAIGIGFGSQNVMNNFISGLILMLERPVRARDVVEVDGSHGTIEKIGARSTQIRATDGRHLIVPNSFFLESNVVNWTLSDDLIRARVSVGVIYGSPTRLVEELIRRVVQEDELVLQSPQPLVIFEEFGDNSLNFDTYFWVRARSPMEVRKVQSRIRFRIDDLFREHELVIAFPQRDVHLDSVSPIEVRILDAIGKVLPPESGQD